MSGHPTGAMAWSQPGGEHDQWKTRALAAEAELEHLREALERIVDAESSWQLSLDPAPTIDAIRRARPALSRWQQI